MRKVCAWCHPHQETDDEEITHGICPPCRERIEADARKEHDGNSDTGEAKQAHHLVGDRP
jgi:hypothetical protein